MGYRRPCLKGKQKSQRKYHPQKALLVDSDLVSNGKYDRVYKSQRALEPVSFYSSLLLLFLPPLPRVAVLDSKQQQRVGVTHDSHILPHSLPPFSRIPSPPQKTPNRLCGCDFSIFRCHMDPQARKPTLEHNLYFRPTPTHVRGSGTHTRYKHTPMSALLKYSPLESRPPPPTPGARCCNMLSTTLQSHNSLLG